MCPSPSTNECHRYYIRKNLPWSHRYFALCSHGLTHWSIVYYYNYLLKYLFFCLICELLKSNDNVLSHLLSSVQFSRSVVSDSLWPHEPQHARPPCPSPTPGVYPNSCPLSRWCHPAISSSVVPFSSCPQSFPASESFPMSQSSHQVAKVLKFQLQHQSFQWIFKTDFL